MRFPEKRCMSTMAVACLTVWTCCTVSVAEERYVAINDDQASIALSEYAGYRYGLSRQKRKSEPPAVTSLLAKVYQSYGELGQLAAVMSTPGEYLFWCDVIAPISESGNIPDYVPGFTARDSAKILSPAVFDYSLRFDPWKDRKNPQSIRQAYLLGHDGSVAIPAVLAIARRGTVSDGVRAVLTFSFAATETRTNLDGELLISASYTLQSSDTNRRFTWKLEDSCYEFREVSVR